MLYVVRNRLHLPGVVELAPDLESGVVVEERMLSGVDVPTTIDRFSASLYAVNARFRPPDVAQPEEFWVTRIDR